MSELSYNEYPNNKFLDDSHPDDFSSQYNTNESNFFGFGIPSRKGCNPEGYESKIPRCGPCSALIGFPEDYLTCELNHSFARWDKGRGNRTGNNRKIIGRFQRLRNYLKSYDSKDAKKLLEQIENRESIGLRFHERLSRAGVLELKRILRFQIDKDMSTTTPPPKPALVTPNRSLPSSAIPRFEKALTNLEQQMNKISDPRKWRYQCWLQKLKQGNVDDRVIQWGRICPSTSGAIGAAFAVGPCDASIGMRPSQQKIEDNIKTIQDVNAKGNSIGIFRYLRSEIVFEYELTSSPLGNFRRTHDDIQRAINKLRIWSTASLGGASAMPSAYVSIKDWIGLRQNDSKSIYSCL